MPETSTLSEAVTMLCTTERLLLDFLVGLRRDEQRAGARLDPQSLIGPSAPVKSVEQLTPSLLAAVHQFAVLRVLLTERV